MRYSKLFGKTQKNAKEFDSVNATLLLKGGFIDQTMAGVYTFLPLGLRVLSKIETIVREEINKISSELLMPSIVPKSLWERTGRLATVDVLFKVSPANVPSEEKNKAEYILSATHEEVVTPLGKKFYPSYKDLPFSTYQIQTKFRNEPRPKAGLLRCREFRMKDLYSFHASKEDLDRYYEIVKDAYWKIFERLGLKGDTHIALASGGDFTEDYSHEFQTICEAGEDTIFIARKATIAFNREVAPSKAPPLKDGGETLQPFKEVEGKGIIGVEALAEYLHIPVEKTTKTLLFENEKGEVIAAAVRGGYDVNEEKLRKVSAAKTLKLASAHVVRKMTQAEIGYAGLLNLPPEVKVFMDESLEGRQNFECGANKTDYHVINVNFDRDIPRPKQFYDIKTAKPGDLYPETGEAYAVVRAAEVGNIFPLMTKFTEVFDYSFTDEAGDKKAVIMGCFGLGTSRVMGVLVEKFHDEQGIVWPRQVAPFLVYLIGLNKSAEDVYKTLINSGIEVLLDDRENVSAGEKFADADLIGIPVRLVVSPKTGDKIEWKERTAKHGELLSFAEVTQRLEKLKTT